MARPKKTESQTSLIADPEEDLEGAAEDGEEGRRKRTLTMDVTGLPEGVRALLRLKPWREAKEFSAYVYRKEPDAARPGRVQKKFLTKVYNTEIEESWLQARYPRGGRFAVIYQIPHPDKPGDVQIHADDFDIDPVEPAAVLAPGAGSAPVPAQAGTGDPYQLGQLRALAEIIVLLREGQPVAPAPPAWMDKMYQEKIRRVDELEERLQRKLTAGAMVVGTREPENELSGWPEFLRPFVPKIKEFGINTLDALAQKLMGKGMASAGLRFLVLNNPHFRAIWENPERRQAAATSIIQALGPAGEALVRLFAEEMAAETQGGTDAGAAG